MEIKREMILVVAKKSELTTVALAFEVFERFSESKKVVMLDNWRTRSELMKKILVATLCSGADSPVVGLKDMEVVLNSRCKEKWSDFKPNEVCQTHSCDQAKYARRFININTSACPLLFQVSLLQHARNNQWGLRQPCAWTELT